MHWLKCVGSRHASISRILNIDLSLQNQWELRHGWIKRRGVGGGDECLLSFAASENGRFNLHHILSLHFR
jgi:hypothetical protein